MTDELRRVGLKVTTPRIKILALFEEADTNHLSADDVFRLMVSQGEDVGLATIYRTLTQFESAGLLTKLHLDGQQAVYELSDGSHHDHMVDVSSGDVIEFLDPVIEKRQKEIAEEHGFEIVDHSMVIYVRKKS